MIIQFIMYMRRICIIYKGQNHSIEHSKRTEEHRIILECIEMH